MRYTQLAIFLLFSFQLVAQYGSFDAAAVKKARELPTVVVLDDGDTPYNKAIMDAIKAEWKFSGEHEFVKAGDLAMQPIVPEKLYLLKTSKTDPKKFEGTFLTLVQGWKLKKNQTLDRKGNAFTELPAEQELAFILIDEKMLSEKNNAQMLLIYVKHLQDYLKLVESGKITDKTTADRTYQERNRLIKELELLIGKEHLDQTLPDLATIKAEYKAGVAIVPVAELMNTVQQQDGTKAITDVVLTVGDHRNKHCFKRVFNAGTGELMYQRDDAAIYGKKEGFMIDDLKTIERAR